jgi:hypothetical protein
MDLLVRSMQTALSIFFFWLNLLDGGFLHTTRDVPRMWTIYVFDGLRNVGKETPP